MCIGCGIHPASPYENWDILRPAVDQWHGRCSPIDSTCLPIDNIYAQAGIEVFALGIGRNRRKALLRGPVPRVSCGVPGDLPPFLFRRDSTNPDPFAHPPQGRLQHPFFAVAPAGLSRVPRLGQQAPPGRQVSSSADPRSAGISCFGRSGSIPDCSEAWRRRGRTAPTYAFAECWAATPPDRNARSRRTLRHHRPVRHGHRPRANPWG